MKPLKEALFSRRNLNVRKKDSLYFEDENDKSLNMIVVKTNYNTVFTINANEINKGSVNVIVRNSSLSLIKNVLDRTWFDVELLDAYDRSKKIFFDNDWLRTEKVILITITTSKEEIKFRLSIEDVEELYDYL